jgi:hypothetical protein
MRTAYKAFPTEFFLDFAIIMTFSVIYVSVKFLSSENGDTRKPKKYGCGCFNRCALG